MENTNPEGKSLQEIIQEADGKKLTIVLVSEPITQGHHRIAAMIEMDNFMVIRTSNLPVADQMQINLSQSAEYAPPMVFTAPIREAEKIYTPEILSSLDKPWYHSLPDKKRKKGK